MDCVAGTNREQFSSRAHLSDNITGNNGGRRDPPYLPVWANRPMQLSANIGPKTSWTKVICNRWLTKNVLPTDMLVIYKTVDEPLPCPSRVFSLRVQCMRIHSLSSHFRGTKVLKRERAWAATLTRGQMKWQKRADCTKADGGDMRDPSDSMDGEPMSLCPLDETASFKYGYIPRKV